MTLESSSTADAVAIAAKHMITVDDLHLLCDLFYLPFEHGSKSLTILREFYWLKNNASVLVAGDGVVTAKKHGSTTNGNSSSSNSLALHCTAEWHRRAAKFELLSSRVFEMARKLVRCENKEIVYELYSYLWELTSALALLMGYVEWLKLGHFPKTINSFTQGSYTCK